MLPVAELTAPLSDAVPCGANLEYDPAYQALFAALQGKPERAYGDKIYPVELPDWRAVHEQALELAARTRDLRVLVVLARASARQHGLAAYADALNVIATLLEQQWEPLHPQLDPDDGNDLTMRLNALDSLVDGETGLSELRAARIGSGRSELTVRAVELALGAAQPIDGELPRSKDDVTLALKDGEASRAGLLEPLLHLGGVVERIDAVLVQRLGGGQGPDLHALHAIAKALAAAAASARVTAAASDPADAGDGAASTTGTGLRRPIGDIASRDDVMRTLERVCSWIEHNEPSNPAPLLIRRAQRLMSKSFLDIIRDLLPDDVGQVEKLAGVDGAGGT